MKLVLCSICLIVLLSATGLASDKCPYTRGEATLEYTTCTLEKPVEVVTDDEVTIRCLEKRVENNRWVQVPMAGVKVFITGYDDDDEPIEYLQVNTKKDGTYTFKPSAVGRYLIQVGEHESVLDVGENPVVNKGQVKTKSKASAPADEEPPKAVEEKLDETPKKAREEPKKEQKKNLLDMIMGCGKGKEDKEDASELMMFLANLLIS